MSDPYRYFRVEARELLDGLSEGVLALERGTAGSDGAKDLLRLAHTLKGAARVVRRPVIAEAAHDLEGLLGLARDAEGRLTSAEASQALALLDRASDDLAALDAADAPAGASEAGAGATSAPGAARPERASGDVAVTGMLRAVGAAATPSTAPSRGEEPARSGVPDGVRVEAAELDAVQQLLDSLAGHVGALRRASQDLARASDLVRLLGTHREGAADARGLSALASRARTRELVETLSATLGAIGRAVPPAIDRMEGDLAELQGVAKQLRLTSATALVPALERAVRDAAQALGRDVTFGADCHGVRLESEALPPLRDALAHLVRNAVAHGIEPPATRERAGKPAAGRVTLSVSRAERWLRFVCADDGAGVDPEAVFEAARRRGLEAPNGGEEPSMGAALRLLREGGLSTAPELTEIAGRGVGLDAARSVARRLGGTLEVRSQVGVGTEVELRIPAVLAALPVLVFEAGGQRAALPLGAVRETVRVREDELVRVGQTESVRVGGRLVPFVSLAQLLPGSSAAPRSAAAWTVVLLGCAAQGAAPDAIGLALGADRLAGTAHLVVQPFEAGLGVRAHVAGAAIDASKQPLLVLEPAALARASAVAGPRLRARRLRPRAPVLIVDDSLTTRMLEQSILESAGYSVELAVSAEDGLERARARRHCLYLVDVEMPGKSGFEFLAETRADPLLSATPGILVTSRDSDEDRRRGRAAGASAHVVKGEFDQKRLLGIIEGLVGGEAAALEAP